MAENQLWKEDPYLTVLFALINTSRQNYQALVNPNGRTERNLKRHKFIVKWLIEEILHACRNYPQWYRGRRRIGQLVEFRLRLEDYFDRVLDHNTEQIDVLFQNLHQEFYGILTQIEAMFEEAVL